MSESLQPKGTILTVGLTHEPVVFSLQHVQPEYAAFVCTPGSTKTLDRVREEYPLTPSKVRQREVPDNPEQIGRLVHEFYAAYLWLRDECGVAPENIHTDPTPGRKWMSAGTTMIASFLGLSMFYTDVQFPEGKPDPTTMRCVPLGNAYDQTGFLEAEKGRELFNRYEFAAAAEVFRRIHPSLSGQADLYSGLTILAQTLHQWELFEHYEQSLLARFHEALERFSRAAYSGVAVDDFDMFLSDVERLASAIEEVTVSSKPALLASVDLVLNAGRRVDQGRYDDAMARAYRALESLSQLYLVNDYHLESGKPDYAKLTPLQQNALKSALGDLPQKIALEKGWQMLFALGHPASPQIIKKKKDGKLANQLGDLLTVRNQSILAHGWKPVGESAARTVVERLKEMILALEGEDARRDLSKLRPPRLPSFWSQRGE